MSSAVAERRRGRKKTYGTKFEVRDDPEILARLDAAADRHGLDRSAYIRMVLRRELEREEGEQVTKKPTQ